MTILYVSLLCYKFNIDISVWLTIPFTDTWPEDREDSSSDATTEAEVTPSSQRSKRRKRPIESDNEALIRKVRRKLAKKTVNTGTDKETDDTGIIYLFIKKVFCFLVFICFHLHYSAASVTGIDMLYIQFISSAFLFQLSLSLWFIMSCFYIPTGILPLPSSFTKGKAGLKQCVEVSEKEESSSDEEFSTTISEKQPSPSPSSNAETTTDDTSKDSTCTDQLTPKKVNNGSNGMYKI